MKIWKHLYPTQEIFPQHLLRKIKLWLDWALFLTCTLLQEGFPTNIDLTYPQFMLAQTDCSCATRFRHGMVGGGILDQRQILGQFARNSQCDDIRQKLEFHYVHLELGALGYNIETFLFYWSWGFFQKKNHQGRFSFLKTQGSPLWI